MTRTFAIMTRFSASLCAPILAAGLLLAASSTAHASSNPNIPDWVTQAAGATGDWGNAKAVYLLEDTLLTVQPDGHAVERYRAVVKILRPQGRDYAAPVAAFSKEEKLESFHVWSIGPDGHHYAMKDSDYIDKGADEDGILYNDMRVRMANPPGADPGGIIAWEVVEQHPSYLSEDFWDFQNEIPSASSVYEVDLPPGWHQRAVWFHHAPVTPSEVSPNHFRWQLSAIDGVDLSEVPLHPAWGALASRMSLHFAANEVPEGDALWAQIGNWYYNLAAPESEGGSGVAAEAKSIASTGDDFMVRLDKVADFMQKQIRYVGIEIGIGNLQPHPAADVFQKRYGDCKDKVTLMIAMLDAVGVRATWVSVDHRRGLIDPGAPSIAGDHVIIGIEIPKGYDNPRLQAVVTAKTGKRYLIFDPTNPYVPIGELPAYLQGGYGLLSAGSDSQIIALPILNPHVDAVQRTAKFALAPDGTLTGDVTVLRNGSLADDWRGTLAQDSDKEQRQLIERSLQQDFSSFTLQNEKAQNIGQLDKPLELDYSFTAPLYAKNAGALLLVRPRVVGSVAEGLDDKARKVPISFPAVGTWKDSFDVSIPAGYTVDDVPDPVNLDVGFATYHSEVKAQGNVLHYQREYVLKQVTLPAADYPALRKLEATITTDENSDAVLKKQ